ncbi:MAG: GDP-mannose 4,6-dehydratase, partial [Ferruginibacter sp.]|nr:GDP-mannose 4,6-dehydratase [Ferruginibacter sp.]
NDPENLPSYKFVEYNFVKLNLLDKEDVAKILLNFLPDFILHLASYSSVAYSWKNPVDAFVNHSNLFLNLVDQVRLLGIKCRILSIGSSEEYGKITDDEIPLKESARTKPQSPYAVARVAQEMLSEIYANDYKVDIILTRSFNHIGPGQKDIFVISSFAKKLTDIKKNIGYSNKINVGNITVTRDFVDVRDVVRAYYLLLQKGKTGQVYNICSGKGYTLEHVLETLMNQLQIKPAIIVDETLIRPDENKIVIGSGNKIFIETGWQPTISLNESLKDIIDYWMKKK